MSAPAPDLRPLAMGELVDRSATFWRRHLRSLFGLYFAVQLSFFIVTKLFELMMARSFPLLRGGAAMQDALQNRPSDVLQQALFGVPLFLALLLFYFFGSFLVAIAGTHFVASSLLGRPASMGRSLARMRGRLGATLRTYAFSLLYLMFGMAIFCLPGTLVFAGGLAATSAGSAGGGVALVAGGAVLLLLGILGCFLWYMLRFFLSSQVLAMEELGAWETVKRSGALVSGRIDVPGLLGFVKVRATILMTVVLVILTVVSTVTSLPALLIQFSYANPLEPGADISAIPQYLMIPAQLLQVVSGAVFSPLFAVFSATFYVDMRVRREALDLEVKLAAGPPA